MGARMTRRFPWLCLLPLAACTQANPMSTADDDGMDGDGLIDGGVAIPESGLTVEATSVIDERNDTIEFDRSGKPIAHEHDPALSVALGGADCPDVFKHAYLMTGADDNPIRFRLIGARIAPTAATAQFRTADGKTVGRVHPVLGIASPDGETTAFEITALRDGPSGDSFLGSVEGAVRMRFVARGLDGDERIHEACWTNHPLPAPLFIGEAAVPDDDFALHRNSLNSTSATPHLLSSRLINSNSPGLGLMAYSVMNGTDETPLVTFTLTRPAAAAARSYTKRHLRRSITTTPSPCPDAAACAAPVHQQPVNEIFAGTLLPSSFAFHLLALGADGVARDVPCVRCNAEAGTFVFQLAAQTRYRVEVRFEKFTFLKPGSASDPFSGEIADTVLSLPTPAPSVPITGLPLDVYGGCTKRSVTSPPVCVERMEFQRYRAIHDLRIATEGDLVSNMKVAVSGMASTYSLGEVARPRAVRAMNFATSVTLPPVP
jgi:hypothetical protein